MKKITSLLLLFVAAIAMLSCADKEQDQGVAIGVATYKYSLANAEGATVDVAVKALHPVEEDVDVPVTFTGAEEGVDFTASARAFHIAKGQTGATITLTRKLVARTKTMLVHLQEPSQGHLGLMSYTQVELVGANVYNFESASDVLTLKRSYPVELKTDLGQRFSYADTTKLDVTVDPQSTAVEGTHFKFANDERKAVFPAGKDVGTISLEFLKLEAGKDNIVLRLADSNGLIAGNTPAISIKIVGGAAFGGTWAFKAVSNYQWLRDNCGVNTEILFKASAATDYFILQSAGADYAFTPHFEGDLKNYFAAPCAAKADGTSREFFQELAAGRPPRYVINMLKFDHINQAFSPTDSNVKPTRVGFRLITDSKTGEELLEMTINDYAPTENTIKMDWGETWLSTYNTFKASGDNPVMRSCPIRLHFTRVK